MTFSEFERIEYKEKNGIMSQTRMGRKHVSYK